MKNIGFILSGGGSRGAYQIGVWEALKSSGLLERIHTIAGVSIGAINGAAIIQEVETREPQHVVKMWQTAVPGDVFNAVPEGLKDLEWTDYLELGFDSLKNFKVRIDPLIDRLFQNTIEGIIRQSDINYIIAAWNRSRLKTDVFPIEDIPEGLLVDHILASASFPAFGAHKIGSQYYLDGGIGSNLPLNLAMDIEAVQKGLAIDVGSFMRYRPGQLLLENKYKDQTMIIRPSKFIPSPANFSQSAIAQMLEVGFEDGRKQAPKIREYFEL